MSQKRYALYNEPKVLKTFQVAHKRADRLPTFPARPNISCLVHTTGKHAVKLLFYHNKHANFHSKCVFDQSELDPSHKQKRKPIYPFVRKWSKFLKNCRWQTASHELLRFGQQSEFSLQNRLLLKLSYNARGNKAR